MTAAFMLFGAIFIVCAAAAIQEARAGDIVRALVFAFLLAMPCGIVTLVTGLQVFSISGHDLARWIGYATVALSILSVGLVVVRHRIAAKIRKHERLIRQMENRKR